MRILQMNPPLIIAIAINGLDIMWHGIFAGSYFCDFSNGPQKLITANIFPGKVYVSKYSLTQTRYKKCSTKKLCLFNYNLSENMKLFIISLHVLSKNENIIKDLSRTF